MLRVYSGDKLTQLSSGILAEGKAPKSLLIAAIKYSGSHDKQSGRSLELLAHHKDREVSDQAVLALARVNPESPAIKEAIEKPVKSNEDEDWAKAIRLAVEIAKPNWESFFRKDPDFPRRRAVAANTIRSAIGNGFVFRLSSSFGQRTFASLYVSSKKNYSTLYSVSTDIVKGGSQSAVSYLLRDTSLKSDELQSILKAFCLEQDDKCWGLVRANLTGGGKIVLQGGIEVDSKMAPGGATLRPTGNESNTPIIVTWTDPDAVVKRGQLISFVNPDKMDFSLNVTKSLASGDEEEE